LIADKITDVGYTLLAIVWFVFPAYNAHLAGKLGKDRIWYYILSFLTFPFISIIIMLFLSRKVKMLRIEQEKLNIEIKRKE
jgi:ABC-type Fe3+-siderophore transport system permease subunit